MGYYSTTGGWQQKIHLSPFFREVDLLDAFECFTSLVAICLPDHEKSAHFPRKPHE